MLMLPILRCSSSAVVKSESQLSPSLIIASQNMQILTLKQWIGVGCPVQGTRHGQSHH